MVFLLLSYLFRFRVLSVLLSCHVSMQVSRDVVLPSCVSYDVLCAVVLHLFAVFVLCAVCLSFLCDLRVIIGMICVISHNFS